MHSADSMGGVTHRSDVPKLRRCRVAANDAMRQTRLVYRSKLVDLNLALLVSNVRRHTLAGLFPVPVVMT
jgi:hypothetical protein